MQEYDTLKEMVEAARNEKKKAKETLKKGKEEPGKRDGTGPHKDSAQASLSRLFFSLLQYLTRQ